MPQTFYRIKYKLDGKPKEDSYSGPDGINGAMARASKLKAAHTPERFEFININDLHSGNVYLTAEDWQP